MLDKYDVANLRYYVANLTEGLPCRSRASHELMDWIHSHGGGGELGLSENWLRKFVDVTKVSGMKLTDMRDLSCLTREQRQDFVSTLRGLSDRDQKIRFTGPRDHNLGVLADHLRLDVCDLAILRLLVFYQSVDEFEDLGRLITEDARFQRNAFVAKALKMPRREVEARLGPSGRLRRIGLIWKDLKSFEKCLRVFQLSQQLVSSIEPPRRTIHKINESFFGRHQKTDLYWPDFEHLGHDRELIFRVLEGGAFGKESGINILLYGDSGAGKTEFCKVLASKLGLTLYSLSEADVTGREPTRIERLAGVQLAQQMLAESDDTLLLLDEAEDLIGGLGRGWFSTMSRKDRGSKVFLNRLLEHNRRPMIWTSNDIEAFDPAFLRRMTLVVEMRAPSRSVRQRVWERTLKKSRLKLPAKEVRAIARDYPITPGVAVNAIRAAQLAGGGVKDVRHTIGSIDKAMNGGQARPPKPKTDGLYDLDLLNADQNLAALADRLCRPQAGQRFSFCLYGAPGTGKTAFVRHLAERLEMEVIQKRASDLISCYLGSTEKQIARAFEEARDQRAFLVFDEADSFLRNREGAQRSWEVTEVNEMLTWMECHPTPFACTTNLMEGLDPAALRRFTFKIACKYLTSQQAAHAFQVFFGRDLPSGKCLPDRLAPGDFAVVKRRADITGEADDPVALVRMLGEEAAVKPGASRPIGFVA